MRKKTGVLAGLGIFVITGIAAFRSLQEDKPAKRNLTIIPKNIDDDQLDRIMNRYDRDLGVACNYCHNATKPGVFPPRVDFASDITPEKTTARQMMKMTDKLNKKYFDFQNKYDLRSFQTAKISCKTCHWGLTKPSKNRLFF